MSCKSLWVGSETALFCKSYFCFQHAQYREPLPKFHSKLQATEEPADKMQAFEGTWLLSTETKPVNTAYGASG